MRIFPLSRTLACLLIASTLAFSGCLTGDDPAPKSSDSSDPTDAKDPGPVVKAQKTPAAMPAVDPCATKVNEAVGSWSHDALRLPSSSGESTFELGPDAAKLIVEGRARDFIAPNWTVSVTDPSGTEIFDMEGTGVDAGSVTGEDGVFVLEEILWPVPGAYTIAWDITGYVDGLQLNASADMCRPA